MKKLLTIEKFGSIEAPSDTLLEDVFQSHPAFTDAIDLKKFLILGRKGSGKSSIFRKIISKKAQDFFSIGHTFSDYPWHYHVKQSLSGVPDSEKYVHSWEYLNLIALSKIILNKDNSLPCDGDEEGMSEMIKIEKFILDSYGSKDPDLTQIFTPHKKLQIKGSLGLSFSAVNASLDTEGVPMDYLPSVFQDVNKCLTRAVIKSLNPSNKYYVCYDELDLGFNPTSPDYKNRIIGLLLAAKKLNIEAKSKGKQLSIIVFLRSDIYDDLKFEDKNKLTIEYSSRIEWNNDSLKDLMSSRFTALLKEASREVVSWDDVFDETEEMRGHQKKIQHILDRTFLRPRDLIRFCNEILLFYVLSILL